MVGGSSGKRTLLRPRGGAEGARRGGRLGAARPAPGVDDDEEGKKDDRSSKAEGGAALDGAVRDRGRLGRGGPGGSPGGGANEVLVLGARRGGGGAVVLGENAEPFVAADEL